MAAEPFRIDPSAKWPLLLGAAAVATTVWALVAWTRLQRADAAQADHADSVAREVADAEKLISLRSSLGVQATTGEPQQDFIPFLEAAASKAGIARETLSINMDNPRPATGRSDLIEQETRLDLKEVSSQGLSQMLSAAEREVSGLQVREIVMSPLGDGKGWSARVMLVVRRPAGQ